MKTIAVVDAGWASGSDYRAYFDRLRQETGAAHIIVITGGDLTCEGRLAVEDKFCRTGMLREAGASAVVQMPLCSVLLAENVFAFSVTAMLQKLNCADMMAIPFTGGSRELFDAITSFLFDEPLPYQKRMRALRAGGAELRVELPGVLDEFIPGAGEFLRVPMNRMAVEYYNTLRRAYFPAKPHILQVEKMEMTAEACPVQDRFLFGRAAEIFRAMPEEETVKWAADMFSGSERIGTRLLDALREGGAEGYDALSRVAEIPGEPAVDIRRHMMACLTGYRKVDSFVCITYNYIPYIRILGAWDDALTARLREKATTTLLMDDGGARDDSQMQDVCKRMLAKLDDNARTLFTASKQ